MYSVAYQLLNPPKHTRLVLRSKNLDEHNEKIHQELKRKQDEVLKIVLEHGRISNVELSKITGYELRYQRRHLLDPLAESGVLKRTEKRLGRAAVFYWPA